MFSSIDAYRKGRICMNFLLVQKAIILLFIVILTTGNSDTQSLRIPTHITAGQEIQEIFIDDKIKKVPDGIRICTTVKNISDSDFFFNKQTLGINSRNSFGSIFHDLKSGEHIRVDTRSIIDLPPPTISKTEYADDFISKGYLVRLRADAQFEFCRSYAFFGAVKEAYSITKFSPYIYDKVNGQYILREVQDSRTLSDINIFRL